MLLQVASITWRSIGETMTMVMGLDDAIKRHSPLVWNLPTLVDPKNYLFCPLVHDLLTKVTFKSVISLHVWPPTWFHRVISGHRRAGEGPSRAGGNLVPGDRFIEANDRRCGDVCLDIGTQEEELEWEMQWLQVVTEHDALVPPT